MSNIWQAVRFGGSSQLASAFWFLKALFFVSCLYCFIDYLAKKLCGKYRKYIQIGFAVLCLTFGFFCSSNNIHLHGFDMVFSIYVLFVLGRSFQEIGFKEKLKKLSVAKSYLCIVLLVVCIVLLGQHGTVHLGNNQYSGPVFLILCSVSGWLLLWIISDRIITFQAASRVLTIISEEALSVLMLHFLCFKIVTIFQIMIYKQDKILLTSFPVLNNGGIWWVIYTVVGIAVPILLNHIINQFIVSKVKRK